VTQAQARLEQKMHEQQVIEEELSQVTEKYQTVNQEFQELEHVVQPISLEIQTLQQQLDYQTQAELIAEITELQQQINTNQQRLEKYQVQGEELTTEFISLHERQQQQTQQLQMLAEKNTNKKKNCNKH
jgi:chromosome segregation ATPase